MPRLPCWKDGLLGSYLPGGFGLDAHGIAVHRAGNRTFSIGNGNPWFCADWQSDTIASMPSGFRYHCADVWCAFYHSSKCGISGERHTDCIGLYQKNRSKVQAGSDKLYRTCFYWYILCAVISVRDIDFVRQTWLSDRPCAVSASLSARNCEMNSSSGDCFRFR